MLTDIFLSPSPEQLEAAHDDGQRGFRSRHCNPYIVGGMPVAPLLASVWDLGWRLAEHMQAHRRDRMQWLLEQQRAA